MTGVQTCALPICGELREGGRLYREEGRGLCRSEKCVCKERGREREGGREGKESIFNIEMIEENQSTIALGGGAISKKVEMISDTRASITRYINPKDPYMYICEMKDRMKQKRELLISL